MARRDDRRRGGRSSGGRRSGGGRPPGRSRREDGLGGTQVEGRQAVRELLLAGRRPVREILLATGDDGRPVAPDLADLARESGVAVRPVSRSRLEHEARTDAPQGVLARAAPVEDVPLLDLLPSGRPAFLLALDQLTDPRNLGAILRSALGAGVDGVVVPRHRAAHLTPAAAKTAAGAIEHLPMALVGGLPTALQQLGDRGVWIVGLDAGGDEVVDDLRVASESLVVVVGAEGAGLSRLIRSRCDTTVRIPLEGPLGSLNAAAAAAVALFSVARSRRSGAGTTGHESVG